MANISNERMAQFLNAMSDQFAQNLVEDANHLATNEYVANMKNRVFKDGLNSNGTKIGNYSKTSRISLSNANAGKGKKQQKLNNLQALIGRSKGAKNNARKTIRYVEYRLTHGRQISYVDFKFTVSLQFAIQASGNKAGYTNLDKAKIGTGLQFGNKKYKGFGIVFQPTKSERENHAEKSLEYLKYNIKQLATQ